MVGLVCLPRTTLSSLSRSNATQKVRFSTITALGEPVWYGRIGDRTPGTEIVFEKRVVKRSKIVEVEVEADQFLSRIITTNDRYVVPV